MALQKVTASREVFENELQDLEKLMRRKAKQRQKAIKENELQTFDIQTSDSDDEDGGGGTRMMIQVRADIIGHARSNM